MAPAVAMAKTENVDLKGLSLHAVAESVLPFRTAEYIQVFCDKLAADGITSPADLAVPSVQALEVKISTTASFTLVELSDTLTVRNALDEPRDGRNSTSERQGSRRPQRRRQHSRSPVGRGRGNSRSPRGPRGNRGHRDNSRPLRGGNDHRPRNRSPQTKPDLWAAVERGDEVAVQRLIQEGQDIEEKYDGWSPLMKASEEGHVVIIRLLLEQNANLEVTNRKGRSALSFAAAPSQQRPTPVEALRVLLEAGADALQKDQFGQTANARAQREKREEAVAAFEEFEKHAPRSAGVTRLPFLPRGMGLGGVVA